MVKNGSGKLKRNPRTVLSLKKSLPRPLASVSIYTNSANFNQQVKKTFKRGFCTFA